MHQKSHFPLVLKKVTQTEEVVVGLNAVWQNLQRAECLPVPETENSHLQYIPSHTAQTLKMHRNFFIQCNEWYDSVKNKICVKAE